MFILTALFLLLQLYLLIEVSSQVIDLTNDSMVTAGIGFSFRTSNATASARNYTSSMLPTCKIGTLDALYYYIYGCSIPTTFVTDLSKSVGPDFLFSSDKSLTLVSTTPTSLLLANLWQFELFYDLNEDQNYLTDYDLLINSKGCVVKKQSTSSNSSLIVGCGSSSCSGCNIVDFYTSFHFKSAKFIVE